MGLLFIVALVLAWPTYGLSLVAWFILSFFKAKKKVNKINRREEVKAVIEPLFRERFSEFFYALDVPTLPGHELTTQEAHQCGRHIMNYLAHNPEEAAVFMEGLDKMRTKGSLVLPDPVSAAQDEGTLNDKGRIHLTSYRAIQTIMTNNRTLRCFGKVSLPEIALLLTKLELRHGTN